MSKVNFKANCNLNNLKDNIASFLLKLFHALKHRSKNKKNQLAYILEPGIRDNRISDSWPCATTRP